MTGVLGILLANAAVASLVALVAWGAARRQWRPALVHGLWLLALGKLVTPPILPLPLLPGWPHGSASLPVPPAASPPVIERDGSEWTAPPVAAAGVLAPGAGLPNAGSKLPPLEPPVVGIDFAHAASGPPAPAPTSPEPGVWVGGSSAGVRAGALGLWLVLGGALAVLTLAALRARRFSRLLRRARPAPAELRSKAEALAVATGLRRAPPVLLLPGRVPPMLWPTARGPVLLLPANLWPDLTPAERETLLAHELAHVRRRDHWVRLVEILATALFWWYPVTWWARRGLRRAEERCCDEWVLRLLPQAAPAYARGLLKCVAFVGGSAEPLPASVSSAAPIRDLETRLKEVFAMTPRPRLATPVRVVLSSLAVFGLAVFPTRAQQSEPAAEPSPVPEAVAAPPEPAVLGARPAVPQAPTAPAPVRPMLSPAPAAPASPARPAHPPLQPQPPAAGAQPEQRAALSEQERLEAMRRSLEEQRQVLEAQRLEIEQEQLKLQQEQLRLEQEHLELRAAHEQSALRAEAAARRAAGEAEAAQRLEAEAELVRRRLVVERQQIELRSRLLALEVAQRKTQVEIEAATERHLLEVQAEEMARAREIVRVEEARDRVGRRLQEKARIREDEMLARELEALEHARERSAEELERARQVATEELERARAVASEAQIRAAEEGEAGALDSLAAQIEDLRRASREPDLTPKHRQALEREIAHLEAVVARLRTRDRH